MKGSSEVAITSSPGIIYAEAPAKREMSIQDFFVIMSRRRSIVLVTLATVVAIGIFACATSTRLYKGSAEVQVQKESADALSLDNMIAQTGSEQDAVEANMTLQTEAKILQSNSLALSVIKALNLENSPDFQPHPNPLSWILGHLTPSDSHAAGDAWSENASRENRAVSVFESHLRVQPIAGTRLISVEYLSSSPQTAAAVANLLVKDLIDFNFETKHGATRQAAEWLSDQLGSLRKQSEDLQAKVVELQRGSGVFTLGQTDNQGREQVYTPALASLQMATTQLGDAESARIMKGALYEVVKSGDPELISGLAGNSTLSGSSPGISGSLSLLQTLRGQEAQTQAELNQLSAKFGPDYPKVLEVQASLMSTQKAIGLEAKRVADRVKNDYIVAKQVEDKDRAMVQQEKSEAELLNSKASQYEIVRQEATQSRNLYESLLSRMNEADLVAGLHSSNITVVDSAHLPSRPAKPNIPIYIAGSLAMGALLGVCLAMLRDATDYSIQDVNALGVLGREVPIGVLPFHASSPTNKRLIKTRKARTSLSIQPGAEGVSWVGRENSMVAAAEPRSALTEALRALRTTLMQMSRGAAAPQVILITSSMPAEGKSFLSLNLATVYAQSGKKVLLVEADLRTPVLHDRLDLPSSEGLSKILSQRETGDEPVRPIRMTLEDGKTLDVVPAGTTPAYPAELLAANSMAAAIARWRTEYDFVLIDGAPLLPVTDSAILCRYVDFTLIVARHLKTDRRSLDRTHNILESQGARNMGIVLNAVRGTSGTEYGYYGYKAMPKRGSTHAA